jgi:hypothetical protein
MSHGQIRTPVAIKLLNLFDLAAKKDVVAAPSPATSVRSNGHVGRMRSFDVTMPLVFEPDVFV